MKKEPLSGLVYHEGPVLPAVEVVPIYWGADWSSDDQAALATRLDQFFDFILKSPMMDMLSEYSTPAARIQHGRRVASASISDCEPECQLADEKVQETLQGWIASGAVAATTENTLYFIFLPRGVKSLGYYFQPAVGGTFYGYHSNAGNVYYVVVPSISCGESIYPGTELDTFTAISSRELCAAIVNPALDGWFDPVNGEIGDVCHQQTGRLGGYLVHLGWSNTQKACAFKPARGMKAPKFSPVPARKARKLTNQKCMTEFAV